MADAQQFLSVAAADPDRAKPTADAFARLIHEINISTAPVDQGKPTPHRADTEGAAGGGPAAGAACKDGGVGGKAEKTSEKQSQAKVDLLQVAAPPPFPLPCLLS